MTPALLGTKVGMTRVYDEKGAVVPVTVVQAGPCHVTQVKNLESDGYNAVQLGFMDIKPQAEQVSADWACGQGGRGAEAAFPGDSAQGCDLRWRPGRRWRWICSTEVQFVDVIGTSKGKGFAGVMKRHHFGGQCASHGTERKHRSPGSIASRATWRGQCGKPKKGVRMAGHMGMDRVTTRNHPLVKIDKENNLLLIKGALPGPNGGLLFVRKSITAREKVAEAAAETAPAAKGSK